MNFPNNENLKNENIKEEGEKNLVKDDPFIQETKDDPFLSPDYRPNQNEPYMSPMMLAYFKRKLMTWRDELSRESMNGIHMVQDQAPREPDNVDNATLERDRDDELQKLKRNEDLMYQIDAAIERIHNGTYGFCEETGKPIGIERLEVWPIASLTTDAQNKKEKLAKTQQT